MIISVAFPNVAFRRPPTAVQEKDKIGCYLRTLVSN